MTGQSASHPQAARLPDLQRNAPPMNRNPSSWRHRIPIAVIASVGFGIACYLAAYQWRLVDSVWDPFFGDGSERVLDSQVSHTMRKYVLVPDAALGALAYLGDAIYGLAGTQRRWQYRPWMVVLFGIDVIPLGLVSAVLVFLQGAVVGYWCTLCIVTAVLSLIMLAMAVDEVWATLSYLLRVWRRSRDRRTVWRAFLGIPSDDADRAAEEPFDAPSPLQNPQVLST
ncbi:MAG: vitamin K epoxide reductase family protein [Myxococcales bacterium]